MSIIYIIIIIDIILSNLLLPSFKSPSFIYLLFRLITIRIIVGNLLFTSKHIRRELSCSVPSGIVCHEAIYTRKNVALVVRRLDGF